MTMAVAAQLYAAADAPMVDPVQALSDQLLAIVNADDFGVDNADERFSAFFTDLRRQQFNQSLRNAFAADKEYAASFYMLVTARADGTSFITSSDLYNAYILAMGKVGLNVTRVLLARPGGVDIDRIYHEKSTAWGVATRDERMALDQGDVHEIEYPVGAVLPVHGAGAEVADAPMD